MQKKVPRLVHLKILSLIICSIVLILIISQTPLSIPETLGDIEVNLGTRPSMTIIVDINGGGNYTSIQEAIDQASSGDKILVRPGTYYENVFLNDTLTIEGDGFDTTTILFPVRGRGMCVNADGCKISGMNLEFEKPQDDDHYEDRGGRSSSTGFGVVLTSDGNEICNCSFNGGSSGVFFSDSSSNAIKYNVFKNCSYSIWNPEDDWAGSNDNIVIFNDFLSNYCSVLLFNSLGTRVEDNQFQKCTSAAKLTKCKATVFSDNSVEGAEYAIACIECGNTTITGNHVQAYSYSILQNNCEGSVIEDNIMSGPGILVYGETRAQWDSHVISASNRINGKTAYYLKDLVETPVLTDAAQIILVNCKGVSLDGLQFEEGSLGIRLAYSTDCVLHNLSFPAAKYSGIYLWQCTGIMVSDVDIRGPERGIVLGYSSYCVIKNSTIDATMNSLELTYACNNRITNNEMQSPLEIEMDYSNSNNVSENSNPKMSFEVRLRSCHNNMFINNRLLSSNRSGDYDSKDNTFIKTSTNPYSNGDDQEENTTEEDTLGFGVGIWVGIAVFAVIVVVLVALLMLFIVIRRKKDG